jgi:hypothetical protein
MEERQTNRSDREYIIENRRDIDEVRKRFEDFFRENIRFQAEMKNQMNIVAEGQKNLKERFESGTAATLKDLKRTFDEFRVEWGAKKKEDQYRDREIVRLDKSVEGVRKDYKWMTRPLLISVFGSLFLATIFWIIENWPGQ